MIDPKPPAKRGAPKKPPAALRSARFELDLTPDEKAKLKLLGGSRWVREQIDKATLAA